jgi:hypothetical protein
LIALFDWVSTLSVGWRIGMVLIMVSVLTSAVSGMSWVVKWRLRKVVRVEVIRRKKEAAAAGRRRGEKRRKQLTSEAAV